MFAPSETLNWRALGWRRVVTRVGAGLLIAGLYGCASGPGGVRVAAEATASPTLAECPSRPSCVASGSSHQSHSIEALRYDGSSAAALARISEILAAMPRTTIVHVDDHYLHATQSSRWMGYTDDIEFLIDAGSGRIDVRSCSRLGYYDFGVNRQRVEAIRTALRQPVAASQRGQ